MSLLLMFAGSAFECNSAFLSIAKARRFVTTAIVGRSMQQLPNKNPDEEITYSVAFGPLLNSVPDSLTINTASVSVSVSPYYAQDPSANDILVGDPEVNISDIIVNGTTYPAGTVIAQTIAGGVLNALYILTFEATCSDGTTVLVEQRSLKIAQYQ